MLVAGRAAGAPAGAGFDHGRAVGRTDLPHDLAQFVVEAGLGLEHGFWNLVANGATFQSTGRRPTKIGPDLDAMLARWRALRPGDELVVVWPTRRLPRPAPRVRRIPARRRVGR